MNRLIALGVLAVAFAALPAWFLVKLHRDYDEMMFVPRPRDRATMADALKERFGERVEIIDLPVVNRDVNGYAARVRASVRPGLYVTEGHAFSFERIGGRDVCLMTMLPWELKPLRATYRARLSAPE